jgi:Putative esterase
MGVSLTSGWVLIVLLAVVTSVGVGVVRAWPRWAVPGVRAVASRVLLLAGVNILVLLTAAVAMNDQYGFYADWADLTGAIVGGTQPGSGTLRGGGDARSAVLQPAGDQTGSATFLPQLPAPLRGGARRARFTVTGRASGIRAAVEVYLPPGYADPAEGSRRYPVLETFPGYPGGPFVPADPVDSVVRGHRMAETIVIAPAAEVPPGRDAECVDGGPGDPKVETWLTVDVPEWAAHTLRVRTDRESWATLGWSAGGWCAAMATMLHPDRYAAAVVMGGYFRPDFGAAYAPFRPGSVLGRRYDLVELAGHRPPPVALWMQTSQADRLSYPTSAAFLAAARPPMSVQALVMTDAGHRVQVWYPLIPQALTWLASTDPAFAVPNGKQDRTTPAHPTPMKRPGGHAVVSRAATRTHRRPPS